MVSFRDSNANTRPKELVIYIDLPKLVSKNQLSAIPKQGLHSPSNNAAVTIEMPMVTGKDLYLFPISLLSFYSFIRKEKVLFRVNMLVHLLLLFCDCY